MKTQEEKITLVCKLFNVADAGTISKPRMIDALVAQHQYINNLTAELFCANPGHRMFENMPETLLAGLRVERIRRMG